MADDELGKMPDTANSAGESVASASMPPLSPEPAVGGDGAASLDLILDIPVTLSMEIGQTRIPIGDLLQFNPGSVIELDHMVGEPMKVLVNGTLIAHGEVVVVNDKFGIRLTDVVSPSERVKGLK